MEKNISPIKKRILEYCLYRGLSKRKIYLKTGIANGTLDKETGLGEENIVKFISAFPDISVEWLISGEGEMLKGKSKESISEVANVLLNMIKERERECRDLLIELSELKKRKKSHPIIFKD